VTYHPPRRRLGRLAASFALGAALLAGCSSEGADVKCNLDSCTVTMNRGVDAQASVLGVDVKLVAVDGGQVTLDVAGNRVAVPVGQNAGAEVAGLSITVQRVTGDQVVLQVTKA